MQHRLLASVLFGLITILFIAVSCAPPKGIRRPESPDIPVSEKTDIPSNFLDIEKRIRDEYFRWKGTGHRLGGTGHEGIDCSAFVKTVYRNLFDIDLRRSTKEQVKRGRSVRRNELRVGDLVFFKPPTYPRHVGIYLSGMEFLHASKNKGVVISRIDPHYWGKYYWTARRILPELQRIFQTSRQRLYCITV